MIADEPSLTEFDDVEGYLTPAEGLALYRWVRDSAGEGDIAEIGSFMGRSTCWLAQACHDRGGGKVNAVDHFLGSPEHQAGASHESAAIVRLGSTLVPFCLNLERHGLLIDRVRIVMRDSVKAGHAWAARGAPKLSFLFIDGDHSYEATKADFDAWSPMVEDGGAIAFHDIGVWPGVSQFYRELIGQGARCVVSAQSLRIVVGW